MKLPRSLSPVQTVEAATGWPTALCQRVAREPQLDWLEILWRIFLVLMGGPVLIAFAYFLLDPLSNDGNILAAYIMLFSVVAGGAIMVILSLVVLALRTGRVRRMLPRFMAAPWCLKCRYPVPPLGSTAVCPECGEPIPPEIAVLAAKRAGRGEKS